MEDNSRKDLKIQGLREALRTRVAEITDTYETRILDLRIELTEVSQAYQQAIQDLQATQERLAQLENQLQEKDVQEEDSSNGPGSEDSNLTD